MGDLVEEAKAQAMELSSRDSYSADLMDRCAERIEALEAQNRDLRAALGAVRYELPKRAREVAERALTGGDDG